jgi:hypothetical protein
LLRLFVNIAQCCWAVPNFTSIQITKIWHFKICRHSVSFVGVSSLKNTAQHFITFKAKATLLPMLLVACPFPRGRMMTANLFRCKIQSTHRVELPEPSQAVLTLLSLSFLWPLMMTIS